MCSQGTSKIEAVPVNVGQTRAIIVDTPGFDDSKRPNAEILHEISKILTYQYEMGSPLKGIIYIHSIADVRFRGSAGLNLRILRQMCGDQALRNVMLITSRWDQVMPSQGADRERNLREDFWKEMLRKGSRMNRFQGTHDSAAALVSQLLEINDSCVLDIQRELTDEGKTLDETSAGSCLYQDINERKSQFQKDITDLEHEMSTVDELRQKYRRNDEQPRKYHLDFEAELIKIQLQKATEQQMSLHQNVSQEVRIEARKKKRWYALKIGRYAIPPILTLLGMFNGGTPPGVLETLVSWFGASSAGLFEGDDASQ